MKENSTQHTDRTPRYADERAEKSDKSLGRLFLGWMLFPLSLFPLVALMTYDWRSIETLKVPAEPSYNSIGALGDFFSYYGYTLFGLAIWSVPVICSIWGIRLIGGGRLRPRKRVAWLIVFLISASCLVQLAQPHAAGIDAFVEKLNISNAGGAIGYLVATRLAAPLLSDFGSTIVFSITLTLSLIAAVGIGNFVSFFRTIFRWALSPKERARDQVEESDAEAPSDDEEQPAAEEEAIYQPELLDPKEEQRRLIAERREALRVEREAMKLERERIRAEREAEKAEREAAKEAARAAQIAAIAAARKQALEAREAERGRTAAPAAAVQAEQPAVQQPSVQPVSVQPLSTAPVRNAAAPSAPAQPHVAEAMVEEPEEVVDKGPYMLPPVSLLKPLKPSAAEHGNIEEISLKLINTLKLFGVDAQLADAVQGPVVTKYELELAPGTRYSAVTSISDNIMGAMHAKSLRIEAPIPGKDRVGIEVPNPKPAGISFREIFESPAWQNSKAELPLLFGKDAAGKELVSDLATMPHMLVAGATGQGKSVCLNSLINGLLMTRTPEQLKLIMVDPKSVEFTPYCKIPHLLVPVITDNRKVVFALHWAVAEMEKRLKLFARARVRNIYDFNHRKKAVKANVFGSEEQDGIPDTVPYIVIIIDEVADLMSTSAKEVTPDISRLTAKARAAGIHLILATQRPDAKVITGTIKANIPGRVAFKTAQSIDSRTILDATGAENLIGRGDMLFKGKDGNLIRAQGAWISDDEIAAITEFIEEHANVQFDEKFATKLGRVKEATIDDPFKDNEDDPDNQQQEESPAAARETVKAAENADLFKRAIEVIINTNRASVSHFQRKLGIGYNHAAKLCDQLEEKGVIAPQSGAGPRTILLDQQQLLAIFRGGEPAAEISASANDGGDVDVSQEAPDANASETSELDGAEAAESADAEMNDYQETKP
ncbi:MAG: DNA translocase FtsK [Lentisphaerae bacterium]|nr:DNA translocase FtsK [Lentisphaerota bacterium]